MQDAHLTLETLARLLANDLDHEILIREVIPHFLHHCPTCRARYEQILELKEEVGHWDETVAVFEGQQAPILLAELETLPFDRQLARVIEDESYQTWGLCHLLVGRSREASVDEPQRALQLAELAVRVSQSLEDAYDPNWVLDLRARAHAYLGNARRLMGELRSAEIAFSDAEICLGQSTTGNEPLRAEIRGLAASLRRDLRERAPARAGGPASRVVI